MERRSVLWITAYFVTIALTYVILAGPESRSAMIADLVPRSRTGTPAMDFRNAQRAVEFYRERIRQHPETAENYVKLAGVLLQEARVSGTYDPYLERASALLDEALERRPGDFSATVMKASLLMTLHRFDEALEAARRAVAANRHSAFAYGVLCDALVETGQYEAAVRACDTMLSIRPDMRSYARTSYLRELHGNRDGALAAMRMAADAGMSGDEDRVWALCMLANLYQQEGRQDTAAFLYRGILEERPNYPFALAGLAQVRLARGDTGLALAFLQRAQQIMPEHLFLEQMAGLHALRGDAENSRRCLELALQDLERDEELGWNTNREFALLCADFDVRTAEALSRAEAEYRRHPDNTDAEDAFAWSLLKNGRAAEAYPLIHRAMRLNPRNAGYLFHAGMIAAALGRREESRSWLEQARAASSALKPLYAAELQKAINGPGALAADAGPEAGR